MGGAVSNIVSSILGGGSAPAPTIIQQPAPAPAPAPAAAAPATAPAAAPAAPAAATAAATMPPPEGVPTPNQGTGGGAAPAATPKKPGQRRGRFSTVLSDVGGYVERFGD